MPCIQAFLPKEPREEDKEDKKENSEFFPERDVYIGEALLFPLVNLVLRIEGLQQQDFINIQREEGITSVMHKQGIYYIPSTRTPLQQEEYWVKQGKSNHLKIIRQKDGHSNVHIVK
jgi:hypothetical protein